MVVQRFQSLKNSLSTMANRKIAQGCGSYLLDENIPLPVARKRFEQLNRLSTLAAGVDLSTSQFSGVNAEILKPQISENGKQQYDKTILYCHGGAFCIGSPKTHRDLTAWLAKILKTRVIVPEYRLAPEHPYPAAHDDVYQVYLAMLDNGISAADIIVGGDSAGGNLALKLLMRLKQEGLPLPIAAFLYSPWVDLTCSYTSYQTQRDRDPMLKESWLRAMGLHFYPDAEFEHPDISPINGDLSGLPPIQIQAGSDEILLDDAEELAMRLKRHGNEVELTIWDKLWHVFQVHASHLPAAKESIEKTGDFIQASIR